ncbi:MAG: C1 family peptidase [Bacteroidota bacterium]
MAKRRTVRPHPPRTRPAGRFGWLPDLPDRRDFLYGARRPVLPSLPQSIDLRPLCSPVEDQASLGSCTAQALVGALELLERKDGVPFADLSRLFLYHNERVIEGTVQSDSGAMLRDGIKSLVKQGVCTERRWPYRISRFKRTPSPDCYREGRRHQITSYHRIMSRDEMLTCLADGYPFVFGFAAFESFTSSEVARTGILGLPAQGERLIGGHAVLAVGYTMADERFLCRNSWGKRWGQEGYFTIPFAYVTDRDLSDDFWTIRRGENM